MDKKLLTKIHKRYVAKIAPNVRYCCKFIEYVDLVPSSLHTHFPSRWLTNGDYLVWHVGNYRTAFLYCVSNNGIDLSELKIYRITYKDGKDEMTLSMPMELIEYLISKGVYVPLYSKGE